MKGKLLFCVLFTTQSLTGFAQKSVAIAAFEKAFPHATKVKWSKEKEDYEVNFSFNAKEMSAVYSNNGILKETEESIKVAALPASVTDYIKQHYTNVHIKEAARITKPTGEINYEAEVNKTDLIFDATGKFIRQQKD